MKKSVIITGSNRGIGRSMVKKFAEAGYDVYACARASDTEFECCLCNLSEVTGSAIKPVYFDLSDEKEIKTGMKEIFADKRSIDVLVNNADKRLCTGSDYAIGCKTDDEAEVRVYN